MSVFTTRPEIQGTFGVVSSTHWIASQVAMGILERGGNAFDAAVAAGFVLQVVEPHLNGPGGDLPILMWSARERRLDVVCGQGVAPAAADIAAFRDLGLGLVPGTGLLAACVPGSLDAWMLMLRDHGTLRPREVLEPAIHYARHGHPLLERVAATIGTVRSLFETEWPSSAALWLPGGTVPAAGSLFRNPTLAATWERLLDAADAAGGDREAQVEAARRAWAEGFVAEAVDRFCRTQELMDTSGRRHRGLLTGDDMARWRASVERPLTSDYANYTVAKCGPWTQGPIVLQALRLLDPAEIGGLDLNGPDFVHRIVEALKLAMADREAWYGDPAHVDVPVGTLLSDGYTAERRGLLGDAASLELRPGSPDGREPRLPTLSGTVPAPRAAGVGEPTVARDGRVRGDTCHIDVIDRWGNMVSATPSGAWLQSSPTIPELGFCLGTRAQIFWLEDGLPNSLAPGKRPRTTLSPSMALRDGEPYMAFGTPGGDYQDQWQVPFFLRHVHGMNLQEAIDAPSFHTDHVPSSFYPRLSKPGSLTVEGRFAPAVVAELRQRGHEVTVGGDWSEGRLCACASDGGVLKAGANPRGMQGYAVGR